MATYHQFKHQAKTRSIPERELAKEIYRQLKYQAEVSKAAALAAVVEQSTSDEDEDDQGDDETTEEAKKEDESAENHTLRPDELDEVMDESLKVGYISSQLNELRMSGEAPVPTTESTAVMEETSQQAQTKAQLTADQAVTAKKYATETAATAAAAAVVAAAVTTCVAELVVSWSNKPYLQGSKPC